MDQISIHKKLKALVDNMNRQYFVAGGLLSQVQEHSLWKDVKCTSFTDYVESELSIAYTTAHRWITVYNAFRGLNFPDSLLIGNTKMYLIADRVNQDNVKELLTWLRDHSITQCRRRFNRNAPRDRSISFWVSSEEEAVINDAISAMLDTGGTLTRGEALAALLGEFGKFLKEAA